MMNGEPVEQRLPYSFRNRGELPTHHRLTVVAERRVAWYR